MTETIKADKTYCGQIAILGRPNVGKSTLLNSILGEKVSITSRKPETTRHKIFGIKTFANTQMIFVDLPGLTNHVINKHALNRHMLKTAWSALSYVDLVIFVVDISNGWLDADEWILRKLKSVTLPVILVINKVDKMKSKGEILPFLEKLKSKMDFKELIPVSAKNKFNLESLEKTVIKFLPENKFLFLEDQLTDRNDRFLAAEIIREKLMRFLGDELPYSLIVKIEKFIERDKILNIDALIIVSKESHKAMVIGKNGQKLKEIGTKARIELEKLFDKKIFLKLWVKVKPDWTNNEKVLREFGAYD